MIKLPGPPDSAAGLVLLQMLVRAALEVQPTEGREVMSYYRRDCEDCDDRPAVVAGRAVGQVRFGGRVVTETGGWALCKCATVLLMIPKPPNR